MCATVTQTADVQYLSQKYPVIFLCPVYDLGGQCLSVANEILSHAVDDESSDFRRWGESWLPNAENRVIIAVH